MCQIALSKSTKKEKKNYRYSSDSSDSSDSSQKNHATSQQTNHATSFFLLSQFFFLKMQFDTFIYMSDLLETW